MPANTPWHVGDRDDPGKDPGIAAEDESPGEVLAGIVSEAALSRDGWAFAGWRGGRWGQARVCWVRAERALHVVGASEMASGLRELIARGGAPGWQLRPVPVGRTPLSELAGPLLTASRSNRYYNLLDRNCFSTVEEVAATPSECLGSLYQAGPKMVTAVHEVLRLIGRDPLRVVNPAAGGSVADRRALIMRHMPGELQHRYREFSDWLARSSMPEGALAAIAVSLSGEPVPTADPMVCLLLDTAGETELVRFYRSSHRPAAAAGGDGAPAGL